MALLSLEQFFTDLVCNILFQLLVNLYSSSSHRRIYRDTNSMELSIM